MPAHSRRTIGFWMVAVVCVAMNCVIVREFSMRLSGMGIVTRSGEWSVTLFGLLPLLNIALISTGWQLSGWLKRRVEWRMIRGAEEGVSVFGRWFVLICQVQLILMMVCAGLFPLVWREYGQQMMSFMKNYMSLSGFSTANQAVWGRGAGAFSPLLTMASHCGLPLLIAGGGALWLRRTCVVWKPTGWTWPRVGAEEP